MLRWLRLCDYSNAHILVKETITVESRLAAGAAHSGPNKKVISKNCAPFTNYISKINNMQVDDAYDIHVGMSVCNVIELVIIIKNIWNILAVL